MEGGFARRIKLRLNNKPFLIYDSLATKASSQDSIVFV